MRFLHTSDWHLGRTLHGEPLLAHQRVFLHWLVDEAVAHRVDAVLVAGDVYDRAVPPTDAVELLDETLLAFAEAGVPVVLTSGNHDSAIRLGFGRALSAAAGVHIRTRLDELDRPVVLSDDSGEVAVYGLPYLLPDAVMAELECERSHTEVLRAAVGRVRSDAARRGIGRTVVVAHAFVTGGVASESERDIRVGGVGDAPAGVFDGITYTALGHLHGPQQVAPRVRYSGSPLPYSFSERDHTKSVTLVDVAGDGALEVTTIAAPVPRPMRDLRGRLDELLTRCDGEHDAWVRVVLTDPSRPLSPMERLREKWPHTLVLEFDPDGRRVEAADDLRRLSAATDPVEICSAFVEWVDSTRPSKAHLDALHQVLDAVSRTELSA